MIWVFDDGGRKATGRQGRAGDCVVRAIAIAADLDYEDVYNELAERAKRRGKPRSARDGVSPKEYKPYLDELGFRWVPCMTIGSGCQVHLRTNELPDGRLIVRLSRHLSAVIDGIIRDTFDPSRDGTRCVYGYWVAP